MSEVSLEVEGNRYIGWEGMTITRSIESIADAFTLQVSDTGSNWPIAEEDACKVLIDGETVLTGWVERPLPSFSDTTNALNVSGFGRPYALAVCSAVLDRWTFRKANVISLAFELCEPFGIPVSVQEGLEVQPAPKKLVINPGDTPFDVLSEAAAAAGVLIVSTVDGGILITRSGTTKTHDPLIQGYNIKGGDGDYDASIRYHKYIVMGQSPGSDSSHGNATRLQGVAYDDGVRRTDRTLIVRAESGHSAAYYKQRADWEARTRAAASKAASITVRGWKQSNGVRWPVNALVDVTSAKLRLGQEMLITRTDFAKDSSGEITTLRVVRSDAFTPDPTLRLRKG